MNSEKELFRIKQSEFIISAGPMQAIYPEPLFAEIAIVGKSNVGKSSLINAICNNNKLAKTSSTPGKTRLINFFKINKEFYLVDLPGYGYAKASKAEIENWGALMESYLGCSRINHLFLLLDIRHDPTLLDKQMFSYIIYYGIPFTVIATKADKLPRSKRQAGADLAAKKLGGPKGAIPFSAREGIGIDKILMRMGQIVEDCRGMIEL